MKYLLGLILFISSVVVAQPIVIQKPVTCTETKMLLQGLTSSDYKETPLWLGIEPGAEVSKYSVFVNQQTKTWTIIQFNDKIACVLGTGTESTQIFNGPKI
jgi:hypothetical protein